MANVIVAPAANDDLDRMIERLHLPANTRGRVNAILRGLEDFPRHGPALHGRWQGLRFLLGPWSWMLIVYVYDEHPGEVHVVTFQDARSTTAATSAPASAISSAVPDCRSGLPGAAVAAVQGEGQRGAGGGRGEL